jgi:G3E family GTPase
VIVIGGYLGAGKTSLVNHLLRRAGGRRIAVLVNDFGDINIDADLIEGADGGVLSLAGGCVCCDFGADLIGTLETVRDRDPRPDVILIETSGVGLPGAVARSVGLAIGVKAVGVIGVVDAETVRTQASDRFVGDTVLRQLGEADLLLINKIDLIDNEAKARVEDWLHQVAPGITGVATDHGRAPPELILGPVLGETPRGYADGAHGHFRSGSRRYSGPTDLNALIAELTAKGSGVVRAKGLITDLDGRRKLLQIVGRRIAVTPAEQSRADAGQLVWITAPSGDT